MVKELETGGFGTASLVTGILGLLMFPFVLSVLAIIFGAIARSKRQRYGTAGLTLGIIGLVWGFILMAILATIWLSLLASLV